MFWRWMLEGKPEMPSFGSGTSARHLAQRSRLASADITLFCKQRKQKACWHGSILGLWRRSRQMGHWTISFRLSVPFELRIVMDACRCASLPPLPFVCGEHDPLVSVTDWLADPYPFTLMFELAAEWCEPLEDEDECRLTCAMET